MQQGFFREDGALYLMKLLYGACYDDMLFVMRSQKVVKQKQTQQTQNICITFVQRRPNVFDVGPTLYKYYTNVLCLLGIAMTAYLKGGRPRWLIRIDWGL